MDYLLNSSMEVLDEDYQPKDTDIVVSLVTTEECEERYRSLPYYHVLARNKQNHNIRYCKAEMFKDCILGTLLIPDKKSISETILSISFYMNKNLLVLVDDSKHIQDILTLLEEGEQYFDCSETDAGLATLYRQQYCVFRLVYLCKPDELFCGRPVAQFRRMLGTALAAALPRKVARARPGDGHLLCRGAGKGPWKAHGERAGKAAPAQ